ncbi:hypothetical protein [Actinomyces bowdenii]|uniref:Uncharacterized protein n=1 Tax=Actinomyces bowdenii TaxID=131109 RepID=A0A853EHS7_9ACTO|nr:hypothetical protein [Actinomyces bowdenii]MBF0696531.1 hypothetical protein [Actinomyces bowdenii]NYS68704.1 hypothetical protein [Actinomyces bowdenii]
MADSDKKTRIQEVLTRTQTARTTLSMADGDDQATALSRDLSEAWQSPKAEDEELAISGTLTQLKYYWSTLESNLQTAHDNAPSED